MAAYTSAETVVIVNAQAPVSQITSDDLRSIFMGKLFVFPGSSTEVIALDQVSQSPIRSEFYERVANKSPRKMNTYWARYLFTGKGKPPEIVQGGDAAVVTKVGSSPNFIGYVDRAAVNGQVKVVFSLDTLGVQ